MNKNLKIVLALVLGALLLVGGTAFANSKGYNCDTALAQVHFTLCTTTKGTNAEYAKNTFSTASPQGVQSMGWWVDANLGNTMSGHAIVNEGSSSTRRYTVYIPAVGQTVKGRAFSNGNWGVYNVTGTVDFDKP